MQGDIHINPLVIEFHKAIGDASKILGDLNFTIGPDEILILMKFLKGEGYDEVIPPFRIADICIEEATTDTEIHSFGQYQYRMSHSVEPIMGGGRAWESTRITFIDLNIDIKTYYPEDNHLNWYWDWASEPSRDDLLLLSLTGLL